MPEVSVIIPNYNHARFLRRRLGSVFQQTYPDFEVILLDDCSSDNSCDILEEYSTNGRVSHYQRNTQNSGTPFAQWEKGIKLATGRWIWIAESDDESDPLFLERLMSLAQQHENTGIAFSSSHWIDANSEKGGDLSLYDQDFFRPGTEEIQFELWKHCTIPNVSSALIRADLALKFVRNLRKFKACGDWMFYIRILHESNLVHTAEKLNYFRWYHQNTSQSARDQGLWVTEGARLLYEIRHDKVQFLSDEVSAIATFWLDKCKTVKFKKRVGVCMAVVYFVLGWFYLNGINKSVLKALIYGTLTNLRPQR